MSTTASAPVDSPTAITWLWHPRIPLGKITLLAGDPGLGKSFISPDIAARLSTGSPMPGSPPPQDSQPKIHPRSFTLLFSAEDELHDTILPRLASQNADADLVFPIRCLDAQKAAPRPFSLKTGLALLNIFLEKSRAKLIIFDPITSFMDGIDHNSTSQIRQRLTPLAHLAARHNAAVLAITHLNKYHHRQSLYRATGSLALAAIARSVLLVHPAPGGNHTLLTTLKSNLAELAYPFPFRVINGKLEWLAKPAAGAGEEKGGGESEVSDVYADHDENAADEFLRESLASGPELAVPLIRQARLLAISERTLRRAKARLGVVSRLRAHQGEWYWVWPGQTM